MSASSLHEVAELEQSVMQEIEASRDRQLQFEQAALAELERAYAVAHHEAAQAGMDLQTYAAAVAAQEAADMGAAEQDAVAPGADYEHALAVASAEAAAAGMDLDTYAATLAEHEAAQCAALEAAEVSQADAEADAHALTLAHEEAASAGLDLETYAAVLAELEAAELDAMDSDQHDAEMAEQEAAAAGMDLPTYVATLNAAAGPQGSNEQAILEAMAYEEGMALHHAELAAGQASLAGLTLDEIAYLQQVELAQLRHAQALGLLG